MKRKYFCHFGLTVDPAARYHGAGVVNVDDGEESFGFLPVVDCQSRDLLVYLRPGN